MVFVRVFQTKGIYLMRIYLVVFLMFIFAQTTFAANVRDYDETNTNIQCKSLEIAKANRALMILKTLQKKNSIMVIDQFCEFCKDESFPNPIVVNKITLVKDANRKIASIFINKEKVDLAYIFVDGNNLAKAINCKTYAVSANLD
jgi:putative ribosome biogenesis GTPase RsgA